MKKQLPSPIAGPSLVLAILILELLASGPVRAQQAANAYDSSYLHRNNIKINLSAWVLYDDVFILSYERSINKHQTLAITGGLLQFPSFGSLSLNNMHFEQTLKRNGFTIGSEYRFYLAKENKFAAPHGLYLGPYFNYYHFTNERSLIFTDSSGNQSSGTLNSKINVVNLGIQIGYQFVLWKRFTVDLILFAPSISSYSADLNIVGNIDPDHQIEINTEIVEALKNHFPLLNKLISDRSVSVSGNFHNKSAVLAPGLRYSVFIGYRF